MADVVARCVFFRMTPRGDERPSFSKPELAFGRRVAVSSALVPWIRAKSLRAEPTCSDWEGEIPFYPGLVSTCNLFVQCKSLGVTLIWAFALHRCGLRYVWLSCPPDFILLGYISLKNRNHLFVQCKSLGVTLIWAFALHRCGLRYVWLSCPPDFILLGYISLKNRNQGSRKRARL